MHSATKQRTFVFVFVFLLIRLLLILYLWVGIHSSQTPPCVTRKNENQSERNVKKGTKKRKTKN